MARLSYEVQEKMKKAYKTDRLWSFSRISTFLDHPWIYRMNYIEGIRGGDSCYTYWGTVAHDLLEKFYDNEKGYAYENLIEKFEKAHVEWAFMDDPMLKFPTSKDGSNSIRDGYIHNLRHYYQNFQPIEHDVTCEMPVRLIMNKDTDEKTEVLIGYIDAIYEDEEGIINLVDFKTSSKGQFTGKKLAEKSEQLKVYALAYAQKNGVPLENIRMRFDMMKYLSVSYKQKNGKIREFAKERKDWVKSMEKKLYTDLTHADVANLDPFEAQELLDEAIEFNSINNLPESVQELYSISNYYIDVTIDKEEAEQLLQKLTDTIKLIREKEQGDIDEEFPEPEIDGSNRFFFEVLNSELLKHHKGYQEQKELEEAKKDTEDVLSAFFN